MDDTENRPTRSLYDQETPADPVPAGGEAADLVPTTDAAPDLVPTADSDLGEPLPADDTDDVVDEETGVPAWVGVLSGAGLGLAVVQAFILLGTVAQGLADERFEGDFFHKLGLAIATSVDKTDALMLLVAAVLAGLPSLLGARSTGLHRRRAALTFGLVAVLAVLIILSTPLAVRARVYVFDISRQPVDSYLRGVLATYVAGTLGTALVALGTAVGLARLNRPEPELAPEPELEPQPPTP